MIDEIRILTLAAKVLVRAPRYWSQGPSASWRPKNRRHPARFDHAEIAQLAKAGLLEVGPHQRWARLTDAGKALLEARP